CGDHFVPLGSGLDGWDVVRENNMQRQLICACAAKLKLAVSFVRAVQPTEPETAAKQLVCARRARPLLGPGDACSSGAVAAWDAKGGIAGRATPQYARMLDRRPGRLFAVLSDRGPRPPRDRGPNQGRQREIDAGGHRSSRRAIARPLLRGVACGET